MKMNATEFLKQLADETRLRSLMLMQREGELCVCELTHSLKLSQPKISRHLASLRESGIVESRRVGQWMYYSINSELPAWAKDILDASIQGVESDEPFLSDSRTLCDMPNRPGAACCA
jgi:ArsR family transcriptional regulator